MPKVSIIIPLLNKGPHIGLALSSALNQSIAEFEIIVVDNGSTDQSIDVVNSFYDPRIILMHQQVKGASAARNKGIRKAKSELIAFLDADDEWTPDFLKIILDLRKKYPLAGIYATDYEIRDLDRKIIRADYKVVPPPPWQGLIPNYFRSIALGELPICTSSVAVPKNILCEEGGFPEGKHIGEDIDLWFRIALKYSIAYDRKIGAIYHLEACNRACDKYQLMTEEEPIVQSARAALSNGTVPPEFINDVNEYLANKQIERARHNLLIGDRKRAKEILHNCVTKTYLLNKYELLFVSMLPTGLIYKLRSIKNFFSNM